MSVRTRQGSNMIKKIEELQLNNKKKNDEIRKQQEEEEKQKKDKEEAHRIREEAEKEKEKAITPWNLHDVLIGVDSTQTEMRAVDDDGEERSRLRSDQVQVNPQPRGPVLLRLLHPRQRLPINLPHHQLNPPFFCILSITHFPHTVLKLAIALKGEKPFDEFSQALMPFISNVVDLKFVINPLNPNSKENNISSKGEISPNMTKLGTQSKISGNGNVFNKKKVWGNHGNDGKSRKNEKDEFCNPVVWFSMVVSS